MTSMTNRLLRLLGSSFPCGFLGRPTIGAGGSSSTSSGPNRRSVEVRWISILTPLLLVFFVTAPTCQAGFLTPEQQTFFSAAMSSNLDFAILNGIAQENGEGMITSATTSFPYNSSGFTNTLSGQSGSNSLNVGYVGTLNSATSTTSWLGSGSFEGQAITESGSALFSNNTASWNESGTFGSASWNISGPVTFTSSNGLVGFTSSFSGTIDGLPATVPMASGDLDWTVTVTLSFDSVTISISVSNASPGPQSGGGTGGNSVAAVPEPSSLILLGIGIPSLLALAQYRKKAKA